MSINIQLGKDKFSTFVSILKVFGQQCTDLWIKNGLVCQTSDRRSSIIVSDLTSLVGDANILVSNIISKTSLLEPFKKQGTDMDLIIDENMYIFKDSYSAIEIGVPAERYMQNAFMEDRVLQQKLDINEGERIFRYEISKFLLDRLTALANGLSATMVMVDFIDNKAIFRISVRNLASPTVGKLITLDELECPVTGMCTYPIAPFMLGSDSVDASCYYQNNRQNLILKLDIKIGGLPIIIWCISQLSADSQDGE